MWNFEGNHVSFYCIPIMSTNPDPEKRSPKQAVESLQKLWTETLSRFAQSVSQASNGPIPEAFKDLRAALQQSLAKAWDDFLLSDAFKKSMQIAMEQAASARESAQGVFKKVREETQGVTREDLENIHRSLRNAEQLILTRIDLLESRLVKSKPARRKTRTKAKTTRPRRKG